jgi:predicted pyridoxine 5'-phosphate oxidase superfamily flavin-nucleotide-binding protein
MIAMSDTVMITEELKALIEESILAVASASRSSEPNVIAVGAVKVVSDNQLLLTDNYMSITKKNLEANSQVCLALWSTDGEEGYKLKGTAQYFSSGKWLDMVKRMPENDELPAKGAILVTLTEITPLA